MDKVNIENTNDLIQNIENKLNDFFENNNYTNINQNKNNDFMNFNKFNNNSINYSPE